MEFSTPRRPSRWNLRPNAGGGGGWHGQYVDPAWGRSSASEPEDGGLRSGNRGGEVTESEDAELASFFEQVWDDCGQSGDESEGDDVFPRESKDAKDIYIPDISTGTSDMDDSQDDSDDESDSAALKAHEESKRQQVLRKRNHFSIVEFPAQEEGGTRRKRSFGERGVKSGRREGQRPKKARGRAERRRSRSRKPSRLHRCMKQL